MKIHLLAFGKLRAPGLREAADYYLRNLRPWCTVLEHELKPAPLAEKSASARELAQAKEEALLEAKLASLIGERGRYFLLDEGGDSIPTLEWAARVRALRDQGGGGDVALLIGSSVGFSPKIRRSARGRLAFGPQTLSHELARVVLLEQLYRAFSVIQGHPYHNEGQ